MNPLEGVPCSVSSCSQNSNATATVNVVTLTGDYGSTASVQALGPMHYKRAFCNSVVLPDGTVLVIGGQVSTEGPTLTMTLCFNLSKALT